MATISETLDTISEIIVKVGAAIDFIIDRIGNILSDIVSSIETTISNVVSAIIDPIIAIFDKIALTISQIFDGIVSTIQNLVTNAIQFIKTLVRDILTGITDFIERASDIFNKIFDSIVAGINELVADTALIFTEIFNTVKRNIQVIIDKVVLFFEDIFNTVKKGVTFIIDQAGRVVDAIVSAVQTFVDQVVNVVGESLRDLLETISNLPDTISNLADQIVQSAKENIAEPIIGIPESIVNSIVEIVQKELSTIDGKSVNTLTNLIFGSSPVERDPEAVKQLVLAEMTKQSGLGWVMRYITSPLILMATLQGVASANSEILLQSHALINPYRIMLPADIVTALHFGLIAKERAILDLKKTGYDSEDAEILISTGDFIIPAGELTVWWLRDFISDEAFGVGLKRQGWRDDDIANLRKAAFFIPPVQDLITMAVREVFTPEIAEAFGQFDDFPPEFVDRAKQAGVSESVARDYWAAHWRLPSVQMGFEMLHRQVVTEDELSLLLRASDIMPFWRDKLIAISFSPLTRVDIRRMHKLEVLDEEQVNKAYHDIGYNDDNAKLLTDFTIRLNGGDTNDDSDGLADLTRSNVVRFFKDGVFDRDTAREILVLVGSSNEAAELFLISAELEIEADLRAESINLVVERAKAGVILFSEARNELSALGLEELEKTRALNQLVREQSKRNKLPSKSDLANMLRNNIIDSDQYLSTIQLLGFSSTWAQRYLQLIEGGKRDA